MAMAEVKHERGKYKKLHHIEIHPGKSGGHAIHHHHHQDGGEYREPEVHIFGEDEGHEALKHIAKHAKIKDGWPGENEAEERAEEGTYEREDEEEGFKEK